MSTPISSPASPASRLPGPARPHGIGYSAAPTRLRGRQVPREHRQLPDGSAGRMSCSSAPVAWVDRSSRTSPAGGDAAYRRRFDTDRSLEGTSSTAVAAMAPGHGPSGARPRRARRRGHGTAGSRAGSGHTLASAGVRSIISFAAVPLRLPENVYVEYVDITTAWSRPPTSPGRARSSRSSPRTASSRRTATPSSRNWNPAREVAHEAPGSGCQIGATVISRASRTARRSPHLRRRSRERLLNQASEKTLLVSNLASVQMLRVAELMTCRASVLSRTSGRTPSSSILPRPTRPSSWSPPRASTRRRHDLQRAGRRTAAAASQWPEGATDRHGLRLLLHRSSDFRAAGAASRAIKEH